MCITNYFILMLHTHDFPSKLNVNQSSRLKFSFRSIQYLCLLSFLKHSPLSDIDSESSVLLSMTKQLSQTTTWPIIFKYLPCYAINILTKKNQTDFMKTHHLTNSLWGDLAHRYPSQEIYVLLNIFPQILIVVVIHVFLMSVCIAYCYSFFFLRKKV